MKEIIRIIEQIQNTSSKNGKLEIIKANADNELFKETLKFLLDGNVATGISKKKIGKKLSALRNDEISPIELCTIASEAHEWECCMGYLELNNTGTDNDVRAVQTFISDQPEEHQEFYTKMITKTLKLGCDSKTVNKAIPDLIPTWEVQLGSSSEKLKLKKDEKFYLSKKMNGNRVSVIDGKFISRQGKEFKGMSHILADIKALELDGWFLDGELIRKNVDNVSDGENFRIGTGIINSDAANKEEIEFVIFDILPVDEFKSGKFTTTYDMRKQLLVTLDVDIELYEIENMSVVPMIYEGTDQSQIDKMLQYAVDHDWEGLMLNKDAPYKNKRTTDLIKIKRFYTMDLPIVDVIEGDGRLQGTLGALVVQYKDNTVNVGTGYTDSQREDLWARREELIGQIVEIKYKEISKDKKTKLESLQFPVFVGFRNDKTEPSYD